MRLATHCVASLFGAVPHSFFGAAPQPFVCRVAFIFDTSLTVGVADLAAEIFMEGVN